MMNIKSYKTKNSLVMYVTILLSLVLFSFGCKGINPISTHSVGVNYLEQGKFDDAIYNLRQSVRQDPKNLQARVFLGEAYYKIGNYDLAILELEKVKGIEPNNPRMRLYLGLAYLRKMDFSKAIKEWKAYTQLDPDSLTTKEIKKQLTLLIRQEMKKYAVQALENEKGILLQSVPPNTLAVNYFNTFEVQERFLPLRKGLAQMLITDLSKVEELEIVERIKLQALLNEIDLEEKGLTDKDTAPRLRKLLGASKIVNGSLIGIHKDEGLLVLSDIMESAKGDIIGKQEAEDFIKNFYKLEKALVFQILEDLGLEPTEKERCEINVFKTTNFKAFLYYSKGIDALDYGDWGIARENFKNALSEDPGFQSAEDALESTPSSNEAMRFTIQTDQVHSFRSSGGNVLVDPVKIADWISGDPTFIQVAQDSKHGRNKKISKHGENEGLVAMLSVPYEKALVRGNIPVFGLAYGKGFSEYRVEYGEGKDPLTWFTIKTSKIPQSEDMIPTNLDFSADITIPGNLATWDTGLKSYVYLPSYPPDHPIDLNDTYTLRLIVKSKSGEEVEDRVTVDVGEAIPNAWGGVVRSKDRKVALMIPDQALMDSFRIISIKPVEGEKLPIPQNCKLVGHIYKFREKGERFTKSALLEIEYPVEVLSGKDPNKLGIYNYDPEKAEWICLKSIRSEKKIIAMIKELSSYYAVFISDRLKECPVVEDFPLEPSSPGQLKTLKIADEGEFYLLRNTFETDMDEWSNRNGDVGAQISLDNMATYDGTYCLKIVNSHRGGNFACNVRRTPFDARKYPRIRFDYKISGDVKIDFLVKTGGRWYVIRFTDDPKELKYKRVNMANIGSIEGVTADYYWHTASFNLYEMLKTKTKNHIVEEMVMADWDVDGYMKLRFGTNPQKATYFIDNFEITREVSASLKIDEDVLLIDDFNQKKEANSLGGLSDIFVDSEGGSCRISFENENSEFQRKGHALKIAYDLPKPGSFAVYLTRLQNLDLAVYKTLTFLIRGTKGGEIFKVGLKDRSSHESKVLVTDFLHRGISIGWQKVEIPLFAFSKIMEWSAIESINISFENILGCTEGAVLLDNIQFEKGLSSFVVDNFEKGDETNLLGGKGRVFSNGAAAINGDYVQDSNNTVYRISYGGNIGDLFTYAGWTSEIHGIDVSQCDNLSFSIKGADGAEEPNVYLDDGNYRWGKEIREYITISPFWQKVSIPLNHFSEYGVDLSHIMEFQLAFEWKRMSGTIYIDDIEFGCSKCEVKEK